MTEPPIKIDLMMVVLNELRVNDETARVSIVFLWTVTFQVYQVLGALALRTRVQDEANSVCGCVCAGCESR